MFVPELEIESSSGAAMSSEICVPQADGLEAYIVIAQKCAGSAGSTTVAL